MLFYSWLRTLTKRLARSLKGGKRKSRTLPYEAPLLRFRPEVFSLEERIVPADFTEIEPNDTAAQANVVTIATGDILTIADNDWLNIIGSISTDTDSDYFKFTLSTAAGVFFDIDSREIGLSTILDPIISVFNASETLLVLGDDGYDFQGFAAPLNSTNFAGSASEDSSLYMDLLPGSYFVQVQSFSNSTTGNYRLRLLADANYAATVPVLNSNAGATDTLYLDFNGHTQGAGDDWNGGSAYSVSAYNFAGGFFDGNAATFSPAERLAMRNIVRMVGEDYSPFNLNVTTVNPGTFNDGQAFQMVVTNSSPTAVGQPSGILGVALYGSYNEFGGFGGVNRAFTFANNFDTFGGSSNNSGQIMATALEIGNTIAHEFGHALGLQHYGGTNSIPNAIMETPDTGLNREHWGVGLTHSGEGTPINQDDLEVIGSAANAIGFRVDDHGNTAAGATVLTPSGNTYTASGIIGRLLAPNTDLDLFRFTASGVTTITINVDEYVNDLDVELRLLASDGTTVLGTHDPSGLFDATITQTLAAGTYFIDVRSDSISIPLNNSQMGETGQYSVTINTTVPTAATTSVELVGGDLVVTDIAGGNTTDTLTIRVNGTNYEITDPNNTLTTATGTQVNANTVRIAIASVTGQILFDTLAGNDIVTVDYTGGAFSDALTYNAGQPIIGTGDRLVLQSGGTGPGTGSNPFATVTHNFTNNSDGSINVGGHVITYTGLEPITDNLVANNRVFNFNGGSESIVVSNPGGGQTTIDSILGESVTFVNPLVALTVTSAGDDTVDITGLAMNANVALSSGAISVTGMALGTGNTATLTASTGAITGGAGAGTDITAGTLSVTAATGIGTGGNALALDVTSVSGSVSGTGSVFLTEANGLTVTSLTTTNGGVTITVAAGDLTLGTMTAGTGGAVSLTATLGAILDDVNDTTADVTTTGAVTLAASTGISNATATLSVDVGSVTAATTATGRLDLNLLDANASGVTVTSAQATSSGNVHLFSTNAGSGAGTFTFTNVVANNGDILIEMSNGNITVVNVSAAGTAGKTIDVTAQGAGKSIQHASGTIQTTGGTIALNADAMTLSGGSITSGAANVFLRPFNLFRNIQVGTGASDGSTLGLTGAELTTVTTAASHSIIVGGKTAFIGNISVVGAANLGTRNLGLETLSGSITETAANVLTVGNLSFSATGNVTLDTAATMVAGATGAGAITLNEADGLTIGSFQGMTGLSTTNGNIDVTTGGALTVSNEVNARTNGSVGLISSGGIAFNANALSTAGNSGNAGDGSGTVTVAALGGALTTSGGAVTARATNGTVLFRATADIGTLANPLRSDALNASARDLDLGTVNNIFVTEAGAANLHLTEGFRVGTGTLTIVGGRFIVTTLDAVNDTANIVVSTPGIFEIGGSQNETIGSLAGTGSVVLNGGTLTTGNASNTSFSGGISSTAASLVVKQGAGTFTLSGSNSFTGSLNVAGGILEVAATGSVAADVRANTGGTLAGAGTITGQVTNTSAGGIVAPGAAAGGVGTLTTGNLVFGTGNATTFQLDVNGNGAGQFDQLKAIGTVNLANATLVLQGGYAAGGGDTILLIDNDGTADTTTPFANFAEGATITIGGFTGTITYKGGDGNDVVLKAVSAAETSVTLDGSNNLLITDISTPTNDNLQISINGAKYRIQDLSGGTLTTNIAGATGNNTSIVEVAISAVTGTKILVNTLGGDDLLTVDFSGGNFGHAITFDGGTNGATGDALTLNGGGTFASVAHGFTDNSSGTVAITGNQTLSYLGLEPVNDNLDATNRTFTFTNAGNDTITLTAKGVNRVLDSNFGESVTFKQPTASLTITSGSNDEITVGASLTIPTISITSGKITLNDTLTASTGTTLTALTTTITEGVAGAAVLGGTLTASAVTGIILDTDIATVTNANVSGIGALSISDASGGLAVTLANTADGAITLGATGGNLTLTSVEAKGTSRNITATASGDILANFVQATSDTITFTAGGAIEESGSDGTEDIRAATLLLQAATGIGALAQIEINAIFTAGSGVTATVTGTGNINLRDVDAVRFNTVTTNNGSITIGNDSASLNVDVATAGGSGDIVVDSAGVVTLAFNNLTAVGNSVTVTSASNIVELTPDAAADITAATVSLTAVSGISTANALEIDADTISLAETATGGIAVDLVHTTNVTVTSAAATTSGDITFTAATGGAAGSTYAFNSVTTANGNINISTSVLGNISLGNINASGTAGKTITVSQSGAGNTLQHTSGAVQTNGGLITFIADGMNLAGGTIASAAADVVLRPFTTVRNIQIGATAADATTLGLTDVELNTITTAATNAIVVGDAALATGTITVVGAANLTGKNLHLATGNATANSIFDNTATLGGNLLTATNLTFQTAGGMDVTTAATLLAAQSGSGLMRIDEADAVTVGSFHGITGLSTTSGSIALRAGAGITVSNEINARGNGNVTVVANGGALAINANILSTAGATGSAGDGSGVMLVQNLNGTITANGSGTVKATGAGAGISIIATSDIGTAVNPILTDATNLQVLIGGGGGINIFLSEANSANFAIGGSSLDAGSGTATLVSGTFLATANDVVGNNTNLVVNNPAVFNLNGKTDTIGSLAGTGGVNLGIGGSLTTGAAQSTTFSGQVFGNGTLVKEGAGTSFTLASNINIYSHTTNVNAGTLLVTNTTGSATGNSAVNVNSGGTLAGTGSFTGTLTAAANSTVAPGLASGDTTNTLGVGNTTLGANSNLNIELGGTAANAFDQLNVSGTIDITDAKLNLALVGGYTPTTGDTITIINNDGGDGIIGTFAGLAEGSVISIGAFGFQISYIGGNGNDVVLTGISLVQTSVTLDGSGNLLIRDINGGTSNDTLTITATASTYIISDPNQVLTTNIAGATGDLSNTITVLRSSVTGTQIIVDTLGGNDTLTVNFATGAAAYGHTIVYDAGTQTTSDTLILNGGGTFASVAHSFTNNNDGAVVVAGSGTVNYTGLEPIDDNLTATSRSFTFTNAAAETISFTAAGAERVIDSNQGEAVTFALPTNTLSILGGADDTLNLSAAITVSDTVSINAGTLNLGSGITATNTVSLTSGASVVDGNGGLVNVTTGSLTASANTGIDLDTQVANLTATVTGTGDLAIDEADGANLLNITTAKGLINVTTTTGDLNVASVTSTTGGFSATLTATAGALTDANGAGVNVSASSVVFTAGTGINLDVDTDQIVASVTGAGNISLDEASGVLLASVSAANGNVTLTAGGAVSVDAVTAGGGGTVSLAAGGNIIDNVNDGTADITAAAVALIAATGIGDPSGSTLDVDASTITNVQTATGGIGINLIHTTNVEVITAAATTSGNITFVAESGGGTNTYQFDNVMAANGAITITKSVSGNLIVGNLSTTATAGQQIFVSTGSGGADSLSHFSGVVQTRGGLITFVANRMNLAGGTITSNVSGGSADVLLRPFTGTENILLGGAPGAALSLSQAELLTITTANTAAIVVGNAAGTGTITVQGNVNVAGKNLSLETGNATASAITDGMPGVGGNVLTGTNLTFLAAGGIDVSTAANLVAAQGGAGTVDISETDAVMVGSFHGITGLSTTSGAIALRAGGSITVSDEVNARGNGNVTLLVNSGTLALNANVLSTAGATGNAGDGTGLVQLVNFGGTITTNGSGTVKATGLGATIALLATGDIGTAVNPILTDANNLRASISGAGGINIFLAEANNANFNGTAGTSLDAGSGTATLVSGTFTETANEAIGDNTNLVVNAPAVFNVNGWDDLIGSLAGNGTVNLGVNGRLFTGATASTTFSGQITGTFQLFKVGAGTVFTLSGNTNNYDNFTGITSGTLQVTNTAGSATGSSNITVSFGGTLAGTGSVSGLVSVANGGSIAPGLVSGDTTDDLATGNLTFAAGAAFNVELGGIAAGAFDQLVVTGTADLDGTLTVTHAGAFTPGLGNTFAIITASGGVNNTFANFADGDTFVIGTTTYQINYNANDVTLTVIAVVAGTTTVELVGTDLVITDADGGNTDDTLRIVIFDDGSDLWYEVSDPNNTLTTSTAGFVQVDANTIRAKVADIGGQIIFDTLAGDDVVTVDFAGGDFTNALTYNAGANGAGGDSLTLQGGGTFAKVVHNFTDNTSGSVEITGNSLISYNGLEPITDNLAATVRTFNFLFGSEQITLDAPSGTTMSLDSDVGGELVTFVNPDDTLQINTDSGDDTVFVNGFNSGFAIAFHGGAGTNTLVGQDTANTWNITTTDSGDVNAGAYGFTLFQNLTGGSDADTFVLFDGVGVTGTIDGAGGANTLDYNKYLTAISVNLQDSTATGTGGFVNIQNLIGGAASDTLTGMDVANTWNITGNDAGDVNGTFTFSSVENLIGGSNTDQFLFSAGMGVSGTIDGAGDTDTLDWTAYTTAVQVNLQLGTASGTGGFASIENFLGGSGSDTFTGQNAASNFTFSTNDAVNYNGTHTASSFENYVGGTNADQFVFNDGITISGTIDGTAGTDTLDFSTWATARTFTLTGLGATDGFDGTTTPIGGGFANIDSILGSSAATTDGIFGVDAAATWVIGTGSDSYTSGGQTLALANMETFNGGTGDDTFNVTPSGTTTFTINGNAPTTPTGDVLNLNLADVTGGRIDLNGPGLASFDDGVGGKLPVNYSGIETLNIAGADVELFVNLDATGAGTFDGGNGSADTTDFRLDATGANLEVFVNGAAAFTINVNALRALTITGSTDADTVRIQEVNGRLITQGTGTAIGSGNFGGTATGSHLNTAMANFLGANPTNVAIHYDGGSGTATDRLQMAFTTSRNARYFADAMAANRSGNINVSGTGGTPLSAFRLSFASLTPIDWFGAGGTITVDATLVAAAGDTFTVQDDGTANDNVSQVVSTNGSYETENFSGFDGLDLIVGDDAQTIVVASLDGTASEIAVQIFADDVLGANTGADTINILASSAGLNPVTVSVFAGGGNDTFTVGNASNTLDDILGDVTLNGEDGTDALTVNDQGTLSPEIYTVTNAAVSRSGNGAITYGTVETLLFNASQGDDTIDILSSLATTPVTINGGTGDDTFNVGDGTNSLDDLLGTVLLNGDAGAADVVNMNDQGDGDANSYTINSATVNRTGAALVTFSTVEALIVNAGTSDDTVNVQSSLVTRPVTVNGGTGDDTFNVGDATNSMDNIGTVTLNGDDGSDTVNFNDQGNVLAISYGLTSNSLSRTGPPSAVFGTVEQVHLNASQGVNSISVLSTLATVTTVVNAGNGNDTINVGNAGSLDALLGAVTLQGDGGTDVINLNDQNDTDPSTWVITPTTVTRTGAGTITYGTVESLNLNAGSGADTVTVTPSSTTSFFLDGNNPTTVPGDTLNIDITGVTNGRVDLNGIGLTSFSGTGGTLPVNYVDFETVSYQGADYELFVNLNATVAGSFNGPTGADGAADTTVFRLDATGQNLEVLFNGQLAYAANVNAIKALNIVGSTDADTVRIQEVNGRLITQGTGTAIGSGNFGDTATGSHLNTAMANFLGASPNNVAIHYDGGSGAATDRLQMAFTTSRNARYFADAVAANRSGNINVSGTGGTPLSALRLSFASLTPIDWFGAGGTITVDATLVAAAGDTFTVQDDGTANDNVSQVVSTNGSYETENFSGFDGLDLIVGDDAQTIVVASLDGTASEIAVQIFADDVLGANTGADTINILASSAGLNPVTVTVFAGGGNDTFTVGNAANTVDDILGEVTLNGEAGTDALTVNDQGTLSPEIYTVTSAAVTRSGNGAINYGTVETLVFNASQGDDTIDILSTLATTPATINGGTGDDTFTVGDAGSIDALLGKLSVNGDASTLGDVLSINDQDDTGNNTYDITSTTVDRTGAAQIVYGTLERLNVNAGDGNDTVNLNSTAVETNLTGNDGNDNFVFVNGITLNGGTIDGGIGTDTLNYAAYTTAVQVNLSATEHLFTANLTGGQEVPPTGSAATGTAGIVIDPTTGLFNFRIDVTGITLAQLTGAHLHFAAAGVNGPVIFDLDATQFSMTSDGLLTRSIAAAAPSLLANIGDLLAGNIYVNLHTTAFPGGEIRGQFSVAQASLLGTATGTGGISNLENAIGGSGNDLLTGSGAANQLTGNDGEDVLQGRAGNDTLDGGNNDDLLIGGTGSDTHTGGAGDDRMVWSNGEGSDVMDGGGNADIVEVNGAAAGDLFVIDTVGVAAGRVHFGRTNLGTFNLDIGTTETLDIFGGNGNDTMTVANLTGVAALTDIDLEGGAGDDVFNVRPSNVIDLFVDGGQPVLPTLPGDTLNIDFTGVPNGRLDINGYGVYLFSFGGAPLPINAVSIETVNGVPGSGQFDVSLNLFAAGFAPGNADTLLDTTIARLNAAGTQLNLLVNGTMAFAGDDNSVRSLQVVGSTDPDTLRLEEVNGRHITEGGGFGATDNAINSHLNAAMAKFLITNARPTNIQVHFDGGAGAAVDRMVLVNTTRRNSAYYADTMDTIKSGNINITQTYAGIITAAQQSAMRLSFESLTPIDFYTTAAGSALSIDATSITGAAVRGLAVPVTTALTVEDDGLAGNGVSRVVSNNLYFETTYFGGYQTLQLFGGIGSQTLNIAGLDTRTTLKQVTLNGADAANTDVADDTLIVSALPMGVKASLLGGKGNDRFQIGRDVAALDAIFLNGGLGRDTLQTNHIYSPARVRLTQRSLAIESLMNTPVRQQLALALVEDYTSPRAPGAADPVRLPGTTTGLDPVWVDVVRKV